MSSAGDRSRDVVATEYGYALGEMGGILVLRYASHHGQVRVSEARDDFRHQAYWAPHGWLAVSRGGQVSFAGPQQAVWVRPGASAEIRAAVDHSVLAAYLRVEPPAVDGADVALLDVDESARAAWTRLGHGPLSQAEALTARGALLAGLIPTTPGPTETYDTEVAAARPRRPRGSRRALARSVAGAVMTKPGDRTELAEWAERLHVSTRTLQRDFEREYGTTFSRWRTQQRLAASVPLLQLHSVSAVAHLVGYSSASSYVAAFRRAYGITPGRATLPSPLKPPAPPPH